MLKKVLLILLFVVVLIAGGIYIAYLNRAKIADKLVDYTVQRIIHNNSEDESSNWVSALLNSGSKNVKTTLLDEVMRYSQENSNPAKKTVKRKQGLATMADMLANGAAGNNNDMGHVAQVLLNNLGGMLTDTSTAETQNNYAANDINARDSKGRTLLMNVCRVDVTPKVIKMLLKYGADINAVDEHGRNALMYAVALNENAEVVKMLIDNGADYNLEDEDGKSVYDYAENLAIKRLLSSYLR